MSLERQFARIKPFPDFTWTGLTRRYHLTWLLLTGQRPVR